MQNEAKILGEQLIQRKLINNGTRITAKVTVSGFGNSIYNTEKEGIISNISSDGIEAIYEDRKKRVVDFDQITAIEGMELDRFAQAYRIKLSKKKKKA